MVVRRVSNTEWRTAMQRLELRCDIFTSAKPNLSVGAYNASRLITRVRSSPRPLGLTFFVHEHRNLQPYIVRRCRTMKMLVHSQLSALSVSKILRCQAQCHINTFLCASDPDDTIRILLATDNHLGYIEKDPIRGQDSINAFREILQLAVKHDVSVPKT